MKGNGPHNFAEYSDVLRKLKEKITGAPGAAGGVSERDGWREAPADGAGVDRGGLSATPQTAALLEPWCQGGRNGATDAGNVGGANRGEDGRGQPFTLVLQNLAPSRVNGVRGKGADTLAVAEGAGVDRRQVGHTSAPQTADLLDPCRRDRNGEKNAGSAAGANRGEDGRGQPFTPDLQDLGLSRVSGVRGKGADTQAVAEVRNGEKDAGNVAGVNCGEDGRGQSFNPVLQDLGPSRVNGVLGKGADTQAAAEVAGADRRQGGYTGGTDGGKTAAGVNRGEDRRGQPFNLVLQDLGPSRVNGVRGKAADAPAKAALPRKPGKNGWRSSVGAPDQPCNRAWDADSPTPPAPRGGADNWRSSYPAPGLPSSASGPRGSGQRPDGGGCAGTPDLLLAGGPVSPVPQQLPPRRSAAGSAAAAAAPKACWRDQTGTPAAAPRPWARGLPDDQLARPQDDHLARRPWAHGLPDDQLARPQDDHLARRPWAHGLPDDQLARPQDDHLARRPWAHGLPDDHLARPLPGRRHTIAHGTLQYDDEATPQYPAAPGAAAPRRASPPVVVPRLRLPGTHSIVSSIQPGSAADSETSTAADDSLSIDAGLDPRAELREASRTIRGLRSELQQAARLCGEADEKAAAKDRQLLDEKRRFEARLRAVTEELETAAKQALHQRETHHAAEKKEMLEVYNRLQEQLAQQAASRAAAEEGRGDMSRGMHEASLSQSALLAGFESQQQELRARRWRSSLEGNEEQESLLRRVEASQLQVHSLRSQVDVERGHNEELTHQLRELSTVHEATIEELSSLQEEYKAALSAHTKAIASVQESADAVQDQLEGERRKSVALAAQLKDHRRAADAAQQAACELREELLLASASTADDAAIAAVLQREVADLQRAAAATVRDRESLHAAVRERDRLAVELGRARGEKDRLEEAVPLLNTALALADEENDRLAAEAGGLKTAADAAEDAAFRAASANKALEAEVAALRSSAARLQNENADAGSSHKREAGNLKLRNAALEEETASLLREVGVLKSEKARADLSWNRQLADLRDSGATREAEVAALQKELAALQKEKDGADSSWKRQAAGLRKEADTFRASLDAALENQTRDSSAHSELVRRHAVVTEEYKSLEMRLARSKDTVSELETIADEAQSAANTLSRAFPSLPCHSLAALASAAADALASQTAALREVEATSDARAKLTALFPCLEHRPLSELAAAAGQVFAEMERLVAQVQDLQAQNADVAELARAAERAAGEQKAKARDATINYEEECAAHRALQDEVAATADMMRTYEEKLQQITLLSAEDRSARQLADFKLEELTAQLRKTEQALRKTEEHADCAAHEAAAAKRQLVARISDLRRCEREANDVVATELHRSSARCQKQLAAIEGLETDLVAARKALQDAASSGALHEAGARRMQEMMLQLKACGDKYTKTCERELEKPQAQRGRKS
ncbi:hypothetical protein DIPPA_19145 [Diplonema papillatum]|nr:hypothetical protein DIPPA_19145 [Diplonema papillatum]